jgi:hypothetical protein
VDNKPQQHLGILNENDELRQLVHQLRLKNAELRTELTKTKRDHQEMQVSHQ